MQFLQVASSELKQIPDQPHDHGDAVLLSFILRYTKHCESLCRHYRVNNTSDKNPRQFP